jgi:hypothetical protein
VEYTEVDYFPADPQPSYKTEHYQIHTVDFSVHLYFTNNKSIEISWKNFEVLEEEEYNVYGLDVCFGHGLKKGLPGQRTWDVSKEGIWQDLIGQSIEDIKAYWSKTYVETPKERKEFDSLRLQAVAYVFSNNKTIVVSIAELQSGNLQKVVRGTNNLLVTTNESLAKKTNMLSEEEVVL